MNTNISFEIFPPRKAEALENIDLLLEDLCGHKPEYISVTYGAGGTTEKTDARYALNHTFIKTPGLVHLTCLYQTKADIAFLCDQFAEAGIKNVLALRGDRQEDKTEHGDFLYASDLVHFLKERYDFTIWAACYPEGHTESKNLDDDVSALAYKVSCG